jgi:Sulfotransferase domain
MNRVHFVIFALMTLPLLASAFENGVREPKPAGLITLVGIPKTGSSFLHINMQKMLEQEFGFRGGAWTNDPHSRRVFGNLGSLQFDHTCYWHTAPPRAPASVMRRYSAKFRSSDKVVMLVRDELQVMQSAYDFFRWQNIKKRKGFSEESWRDHMVVQHRAIQACYEPVVKHLADDKPELLKDKVMVVHFDDMKSTCAALMDDIARFLFGASSNGYECSGHTSERLARIPQDRSNRITYDDYDGTLTRHHQENRIDFDALLEVQRQQREY